ncbi:MAG: YVTN family beta-propeller protein [Crocinitomicaceae bacterium]|jgi:YVTN family beta-propeller protein
MRLISLLVVLVLTTVGCKKDDPTISTNISISNGMLVMCEGLYQQNNSSLSWVSNTSGVVSTNFFVQTSEVQLGDTGKEMKSYGGKIYLTVSVSSTVEVLSRATGVRIKQIPMFNGAIAKEPRSIAFYDGKVLVSCFDGYVDVIDTSSLEVEQRIQVGSNPEQLTVSNGKLYVANSGGLNFPLMDSTVSVINLSTMVEETKITVGLNPVDIITDTQGDVYVITHGDYATIPSRMHRINTTTGTVAEDFTFDASSIAAMNGNFLIGYADFVATTNNIALFDPISETLISTSFVDLSAVQSMYGLDYNPSTDRIYVMDAMDFTVTGYVREYSSAGASLNAYHVGLNPSRIVFID